MVRRSGWLGLWIWCSISVVHAQAWIPDPGTGYVTATQSYGRVGDHFFSETDLALLAILEANGYGGVDIESIDFGEIRSWTTTVGASYGLTENWAVDGNVSYVSAAYRGLVPESHLDDGRYRGDLQDAIVRARWQVLDGATKLTPFFSVVLPMTDYESHGHAAVGHNLNELVAGLSVGRSLGVGQPTGFFQAAAQYAYPERHAGERPDRSTLFAEMGYFMTPRLTLRFNGTLQETHGGIDWATGDFTEKHVVEGHDVLADADFWGLGAVLFVEATPAFDLFAGVSKILDGDNSHELTSLSLGLVWSFGGSDRIITNTLATPKK